MLSSQREDDSPYPKGLASWISLEYFRRRRPLKTQRGWVTFAAVLLSAGYAAWTLVPANHATHEANPVSTAHAMFEDNCAKCHDQTFQPLARLVYGDWVRSVSDKACMECHAGGPHHQSRIPEAGCAECHREHRGNKLLARVADGYCIVCHADLKEAAPTTPFGNVTAFALDHPEFAAMSGGRKDQAKLHFNHASHLALPIKDLRAQGRHGLDKYGDRLECASCHEPDAERRYMKPINYQRHCGTCHPLTVHITGEIQDPKVKQAAEAFRAEPAPHDRPAVVRAVLRERLLRFIQENPVKPGGAAAEPRPLPGRGPRPATEAEARWVKGQLSAAEELLFTERQASAAERRLFDGTCRQCHVEARPERAKDGLPEYLPTAMPARWFEHASFRHDSHRLLDCLACHGQAARSQATSDILLPTVRSCQECHHPRGGARSDCAECHTYHNRSREPLGGKLTIDSTQGGR